MVPRVGPGPAGGQPARRGRRRCPAPWRPRLPAGAAGSAASEATDFTSRINAEHLPAGTRFALTLHFEDADGNAGETAQGSFSTAPGTGLISSGRAARKQSFVWTGDTAGQGWGINEEIGGMRGYAAMHATKPDFFIHSGDTIYADGPITAQVTEPDGQIWRNLVTEEVSKVAETLNEFRGRHRYNLMDRNVRAMYAEVPVIAQWDDHETHNNWYPGEIITDSRYTERRVDVLAARGRQAWQEYQPISGLSTRIGDGSTGFEPARIYRKISRGPQLDVFCLDMRTFKDPNTDGKETHLTHILGQEQAEWLIREVSKSKATWKVISADLPLGLVVPDGTVNQESLANRDAGAPLGKELEIAGVLSAFKRNRVKTWCGSRQTSTTAPPTTTRPSAPRSPTSTPSGNSWPAPSTPAVSAPANWTVPSAPRGFSTRPAPTPTSPRAPAKTSSSAMWT